MAKVKVPLYGNLNRAALIESEATRGATIGLDLLMPDGSVVTLARLATLLGSAGGSSSGSVDQAVIWQRVLQKPGNITQVEALNTAGLVTRLADGSWTTRTLETASSARITVSDGAGGSGNPTIDLAELAAETTGTLLAIARDSYGRVSGIRAVVADDIPNLDASKITSGQFADARISESSVTQHEGAIDHNELENYVGDEHVDHAEVQVQAGTGLTGGGDLTETIEIALDTATIALLELAGTAVQPGDLAAVAFSGDYDDLTNTPSIPPGLPADPDVDAVLVWDDADGQPEWMELDDFALVADLAAVAFTGDYDDLVNAPEGSLPADPNVDAVLIWNDGDGQAEWLELSEFALVDQANTFTTSQTIEGSLTISGSLSRSFIGQAANGVLDLAAFVDDGQTAFVRINRGVDTTGVSGLLVCRGNDSTNIVARLLSAGSGVYQGVLYLREGADAADDIAAYGQIWVHDDTPNTLWFTDDAGNDAQVLTTPFAGQNALIGSHSTDTRVRRADTTGALFLLGGTNNSATTGARINLFGVDHATQPGNLIIAAGTGGTLTLAAGAGGAVTLTGNANISGDVGLSGTLTIGTNALIFAEAGLVLGSDTVIRNTQGTTWPEIRALDGGSGNAGMLVRASANSGSDWTDILRATPDEIQLDATLIDINGNADISGTLAVGGAATLTGGVLLPQGSASAPSVARANDPDTGLYFPSGNTVGLSAGNSLVASFSQSEIDLTATTLDVNAAVVMDGSGQNISFGSRTGEPLISWWGSTYYTQIDSNSLQMRTANWFRVFSNQTPSGGTGEITTACFEVNDSMARFHVPAGHLYNPSSSGDSVFTIGAGAASDRNTRAGLDIVHRAQTTGNTGISSSDDTNASIRMYWHEGSQDLGSGEGCAIDFGHQFASDGSPTFNVRIVSRKTSTADANRTHNLIFYTSDGNSTDKALVCEMSSTLGVSSPIDLTLTSDRRLKSEIEPIEGALEKLARVGAYTFNKRGVRRRMAGFIAQEVREVLREAVFDDSDGYLQISPMAVIALVAAAVNELREEVRRAAA